MKIGLPLLITLLLTFLIPLPLTSSTAQESINHLSVAELQLKTDEMRELVYFYAEADEAIVPVLINGELDTLHLVDGLEVWQIELDRAGQLFSLKSPGVLSSLQIYHLSKNKDGEVRIRKIPLWLSLFPPILAIFLALVYKEVITSLFAGIFSGAFIASGMYFDSFVFSLFSTLDTYILGALNDPYHLSIILMSLLIGSMVALISNNGGMQGVIDKIIPYAKTRRSTKLTGYLMGIVLFFDDYANTLVVGSSMRKLFDRFKISREKLAYIVDSTAAPIAAVALITTWIGAELSYIQSGIINIDIELGQSVYGIFLASLKYSFYPFLTLFFVFMIIWTRRDFGPMHKAEKNALRGNTGDERDEDNLAREDEDLTPLPGIPHRWYNGALPIFTLIFVAFWGMVYTGLQALFSEALQSGVTQGIFSIQEAWVLTQIELDTDAGVLQRAGLIIGYADPYAALLWASGSAVLVALILTFSQNLMTVFQGMKSFGNGMKSMLPAVTILVLAWALALITRDLSTATYLAGLMEGSLNPYFLPPLIFILAAFTAFSTGSSWSTMAILYPIAIPSTYAVCIAAGIDDAQTVEILLNVISIVLAASVLGDHCSPLSDTTILSSLASGCDHIAHVQTQLPYALTVGVYSLLAAFFSTFLGGGWFVSISILIVGLVLFWFFIQKIGKTSGSEH